jgi:hypothetical protein
MTQSEPRARSALIIAAAQYEDHALSRLRSPVQDAEALRSVLADQRIGNYRVFPPLLNQPYHVVRKAIHKFFAEARLTDVLLLYLSCHGVKDEDGQLCFAMTDTELDLLDSTSVTAEFLAKHVKRSRSSSIVVLLDCCYSGAFPKGFQTRSVDRVSLEQLWQAVPEGRGCVVITSCTATENAFEKRPGGRSIGRVLARAQPSVFTHAVVEGLRTGAADLDRDGLVSVDELYEYVHKHVRGLTPGQNPEKGGETRGRLIVARNPHVGIPPTPGAPQPPRHLVPLAVATVVILAGAGTGIALALDKGPSPDNRPLTVNTCTRTAMSGSIPVPLGSLPVGRPGFNKNTDEDNDYIGIAFSPDCDIVAMTGNGKWQLRNMVTGHLIAAHTVNSGNDAFNPAITPDGKTIAVPGSNGSTTLWDGRTGGFKGSLVSDQSQSTAGNTFAVVAAPSGTALFTGGSNYVVEKWSLLNLPDEQPMCTIDLSAGIGALALSRDGKTLAVGGVNGTEFLYSAATCKQVESLPGHEGNSFAVAFSPDGKTLAVATQNGGLQWWDLATHTLIGPRDTGAMTNVAFSPDGAVLAAGGYNEVTFWNTVTHRQIYTLELGSAGVWVNGLAFARYGGVLAVGYNGTVQFWNVAGVEHLGQ